MKKKSVNPVYERDEDDDLPILLGDPNLTEELRKILYDLGSEEFGEREGGFESIKILTRKEADKAYKKIRRETLPFFRGRARSQKIFDFIKNNEIEDEFESTESLNDFLADKPINAYVLLKLIGLVLRSHAKDKASIAAKIRHIETYELKNQAIEYWRSYIDPKLSNPKAADLLLKVVKVSHRKLVDYVAEAKRENLPPASKV